MNVNSTCNPDVVVGLQRGRKSVVSAIMLSLKWILQQMVWLKNIPVAFLSRKRSAENTVGGSGCSAFRQCRLSLFPHRSAWLQWIMCLALVMLCVAIRYCGTAKILIATDEFFSIYYANFSVHDIVVNLTMGDNPPLWEILLHYWMRLFGHGEVAMRTLPILFSALTVIPIFMIGERYVCRNSGVAAALIFIFSTFSQFVAHDIRTYALVGCVAAYSWWLFLSLIRSNAEGGGLGWKWFFLFLCNLTLIYSHYLSVWVIVVQLFVVCVVPSIRKVLAKGYWLHIGALVVMYLPMISVVWHRFLDSGLHGTQVKKVTGIEDYYYMLCNFVNEPLCAVLILILFLSFIVVLVRRRHRPTQFSVIFLTAWFLPTLVSFVLSFFVGFFMSRYFYFAVPTFYLMLMSMICYIFLPCRRWRYVAMTVMVIMMIGTFSTTGEKEKYTGMFHEIPQMDVVLHQLQKEKEDNVVFLCPDWIDERPIAYYYEPNHALFYKEGEPFEGRTFEAGFARRNIYYWPAQQVNWKQKKTIIAVFSCCDPCPDAEKAFLDAGFVLTEEYSHKHDVRVYERK